MTYYNSKFDTLVSFDLVYKERGKLRTHYLLGVHYEESLDVLTVEILCDKKDDNSFVLRLFWKE